MDILLILKFLIALAIGALIGIERERKQEGAEFTGIRTFILIAIMGTISAYISQFFPYFWIVAFAGLVVLVVLSYLVTTRKNGDVGITTEVAAFLTFALGLVCFTDEGMLVAPIFAIIITTLLAVKPHLHKFAHRISEKELINTLKFLIIAFVILPLLPDEVMGPLAVFNPFQIWLMVVFISAISFTGYILMKFIGPERGLGVTGIVGGLVSSTAVATSMAARVKESGLLMKAAVFATVVASSMMFFRMLFEVSVINPSLLPQLSAPMLVMGVLGIILGVIIWKRTEVRQMDADLKLDNPFSLKPALIFGALFLGILFLSKIANIYLGSGGVYLASIISGVADVDAITISMALLAPETIPPTTAVTAITLAA
ncbi:MAG: MgtC/SapB family protein, partial [Methanobacterium sp.]|nr:MgtC/SapB family protein [Methanobacterium sp.]